MAQKRPSQLVLYIEPDFARLVEIQAGREGKSVSEYLRGIVISHIDSIGLATKDMLLKAVS